MIKGMHGMFYSSKASELRKFFRDVLEFESFDAGGGWLIFNIPQADLGVHPLYEEEIPSGSSDISFFCDDIKATVAKMKEKGVEFEGPVKEHSYGFVVNFKVPGNFYIQLYQPKYGKGEK